MLFNTHTQVTGEPLVKLNIPVESVHLDDGLEVFVLVELLLGTNDGNRVVKPQELQVSGQLLRAATVEQVPIKRLSMTHRQVTSDALGPSDKKLLIESLQVDGKIDGFKVGLSGLMEVGPLRDDLNHRIAGA